MEPISALVPVAAMLGATADTSRLLRDLQNAPAAISELENELLSFQSLLETILDHPSQNEAIAKELGQANETLLEMVSVLRRYTDMDPQKRSKSITRIRWAFQDKVKATRLRYKLSHHVSTIGLLLNVEDMKLLRQLDDSVNAPEIIILVMGETGSGKSTFVHRITESTDVRVGHSLSSETKIVSEYSITVEGRVITLVDTPGFDDTSRTDVEVLEKVSSWLTQSYQSRKLVCGIVYLHPITSSRMRGSALKSLDVFASLVGPDSFHNILLVTTKWDLLQDPSLGESREEELREHFWKSLIEKGSITARSSGDRQSALAIMKRIAFDQRMGSISGAPLAIQKEIVDEHKTLDVTSAGEILARRMDRMEQQHREELSQLRRENEEERNRMQDEIKALMEEQLRLKKGQPARHRPEKYDRNTPTMNASNYVRLDTDELLGVDPPPPYVPKATSRVTGFVEPLVNIVTFSLTPIFELQTLVGPTISRLLRPRLQKNYSRIEWTCSCGDLLYGDYIEGTPGSLQALAAQLGGQVISGPALQQNLANASSALPQLPPQAHFAGRSTTTASAGAAGQPSGSNQQHHSPRQPAANTGNLNAAATQRATTTNKWLELCIRSGPDTFVLGEIGIAGTQTDQSVFYAIRHKYELNRVAARLFGRFAYRIPNGGVSVEFRKDKLVTPSGSPATASIMVRSSMPGANDAQRYHYVFDPIPMDQPPIDTRTFNHYFHKPHLADPSETWIKRFPQLHDVSLFYCHEKLAKGWGFEITEERNWMMLVCANLAALLVSGALAGISAHFLKDNATGVAIGAWLTAVQTLVITALFWRWTN